MPLSRTVLRSSIFLGACLAVAVLAGRWSRTPAVHAEDRETLRFSPQSQTPASAAPTIQVYSRETVVDVTVTDKDGKPVHGLTKDDFTVKEDGKAQPIKSFAEFGAETTRPPPKLPPHVYTNLQPAAASGATNILLLDFLNIAAMPAPEITGAGDAMARAFAAQNAVKREAKKYVASMPAGTRMIVLGLSNSLRTLQSLSSDPGLISASLDMLDYNAQGRVGTYQQYCAQVELRTRMTLEVLNQIAADATAIKGKKNLLWFSVGIPWLTDPSAHPACVPDYASDLLKTYGLLAAAQIAVDPIDARGVPTEPNAFITSTGTLWADVPNLPNPPAPHNSMEARMDFEQMTAEQQLSMESVAEATGGTAYYNSNDLTGEIAKAIEKGENYYTLSYSPPGKGYDWSHHTIKVTVDRQELKLAYRESYDAVDPATIKPAPGLALVGAPSLDSIQPVDMRAEMGRSMPTSQGVLFDVQVEPSKEEAKVGDPAVFGVLNVKLKGKPLARYGFAYALPGQQIALKPAADGKRHGSLEFDLAAYDADGNVVTSLRQALDLNLSEEQAAQLAHSPFRYFEQLDLPAGALFVRVGVLDRAANKVGTLEIPLTVAKTPQPTAQNTGGR